MSTVTSRDRLYLLARGFSATDYDEDTGLTTFYKANVFVPTVGTASSLPGAMYICEETPAAWSNSTPPIKWRARRGHRSRGDFAYWKGEFFDTPVLAYINAEVENWGRL